MIALSSGNTFESIILICPASVAITEFPITPAKPRPVPGATRILGPLLILLLPK